MHGQQEAKRHLEICQEEIVYENDILIVAGVGCVVFAPEYHAIGEEEE